ncbi:MAG: hypothetical protein K0S07_1139 [Chlamydiales bacterium]|jgi:GcvH upstream region-like protein|nr:hypothetical protein [Chlamydiales bacterium]
MLDLFRKYQKILFIIISLMVIVSFSFFGTYGSIESNKAHNEVAFTAVDGQKIRQSELDDLVKFIATDLEDRRINPVGNFFNDGVIVNDFLKTGLFNAIIEPYLSQLAVDLEPKRAREKKSVLYVHPQAPFISQENVWNYFAPTLKKNLEAYQKETGPVSLETLSQRADLYLEQKRFPASSLKQVLRYQERQYEWIKPDPELERADFSLFHYHNLEDWFGPSFTSLMGQAIINFAKMAEMRGYTVSTEEALSELWLNAEKSFQEMQASPYFQVASLDDYVSHQLQALNLDLNRASLIWRQVLLCRRLLGDTSSALLLDTLPYEQFFKTAKAKVNMEQFSLPESLKIQDFRSLGHLEAYLRAVAPPAEDLLMLPEKLYAPEKVALTHPYLVGKHYQVDVKEVTKKELGQKISLKDTWDWQIQEENWSSIVADFPELGLKDGSTKDSRLALIDSLDNAARLKLDQKARLSLVEQHPEWIEEALKGKKEESFTLCFKKEESKLPLSGIKNGRELQQLLDDASIDQENAQLTGYTQDLFSYYTITLKKRDEAWSLLSFEAALKDGSSERALNALLQGEQTASEEDKNAFEKKRHELALARFQPLLEAIDSSFKKSPLSEQLPKLSTEDQKARFRMLAHVQQLRRKLTDENKAELTRTEKPSLFDPIEEQFKLIRQEVSVERSNPTANAALFQLKEGDWSEVEPTPSGDFPLYHILSKEEGNPRGLASKKVHEARRILSREVCRPLVKELMQDIVAKKAIHLPELPAEK